MKHVLLALAAPLVGTTGQLLLKQAMKQNGPISLKELSNPSVLAAILLNPFLILAAALYFVGFFLWLVVLSRLQLSFAYPILAISYALVPLLSWLVLGESVPPMRWAGVAVICVGVVIVGLS